MFPDKSHWEADLYVRSQRYILHEHRRDRTRASDLTATTLPS